LYDEEKQGNIALALNSYLRGACWRTLQKKSEACLHGALSGGMLPTLGKVAGTFGANFDAPMPNLVGVSIALGLYAILGSIMARVIGNSDLKQAVVAGIAAPAMVVSIFRRF
jgi:hypothetical protein